MCSGCVDAALNVREPEAGRVQHNVSQPQKGSMRMSSSLLDVLRAVVWDFALQGLAKR